MNRISAILVAFSISSMISLILGTMILPVAAPSLVYQVAPYACPEGSEPVVSVVSNPNSRDRGVSAVMVCESPLAEWDRVTTARGIIGGVMAVPLFILILFVLLVFYPPEPGEPSSFAGTAFQKAMFQSVWGLMAVGAIVGPLIYEQVTEPIENPDLMFVDANLSKGIDKIKGVVGEPMHVGMVVVSTKGIELTRIFIDEPNAAEDISLDEGEVTRGRKKKNRFRRGSFLASEVPWDRIPTFAAQAVAAAELDSPRVSDIRIDRKGSKKGLRIRVAMKGFEYKAIVVFDQDGNQLSMNKDLQD